MAEPAEQGRHDVEAGEGANVPAVQFVHVDAPVTVEMVPEGQAAQVRVALVELK